MTVVPVLDMSRIDTRRLDAARAQADRVGTRVARAEQHVVAQVVRQLFGATAALLVLDKDVNDDGNTDVTALLVLDGHGQLLWFNSNDAYDYPGADDITDDRGRLLVDIGWQERSRLEWGLEQAYDAAGGCYAALDVANGEHFWAHFGFDKNLLAFDVTAALTGRPTGSGRALGRAVRHGWAAMRSVAQRIRGKRAVSRR